MRDFISRLCCFLAATTLAILPCLSAPPHLSVVARKNAGGGGSFTYYSTGFDGSTYLDRASQMTGAADGDVGTFSCWVKMGAASSDTGFYEIMVIGDFIGRVSRRDSGQIRVRVANSGGSALSDFTSDSNSVIKSSGWVHILASWDTTNQIQNLYINGSRQVTSATNTTGTIDYTNPIEVGGGNNGQQKFIGLMSELWFDDVFLDLTSSANREKFRTTGGAPADLGADGSTPTGASPLLYLPNPYSSFEINAGTGGDFTESGTLTDGGSDKP